MNELVIILVASFASFAFVALFGAFKLMSSAIKMTEKASEPEPSIMTELDRARSEIAFLKKDREAILRENRRLQVRIEQTEKATMPTVDFTKCHILDWVTADAYGGIIGHEKKPVRKEVKWVSDGYWCAIAPKEAYRLCKRLPSWNDVEPTPVCGINYTS